MRKRPLFSYGTLRAPEVQRALFGRRIITGTASDPGVLRLLPPLSFSAREADLVLAGLKEVLA